MKLSRSGFSRRRYWSNGNSDASLQRRGNIWPKNLGTQPTTAGSELNESRSLPESRASSWSTNEILFHIFLHALAPFGPSVVDSNVPGHRGKVCQRWRAHRFFCPVAMEFVRNQLSGWRKSHFNVRSLFWNGSSAPSDPRFIKLEIAWRDSHYTYHRYVASPLVEVFDELEPDCLAITEFWQNIWHVALASLHFDVLTGGIFNLGLEYTRCVTCRSLCWPCRLLWFKRLNAALSDPTWVFTLLCRWNSDGTFRDGSKILANRSGEIQSGVLS